LGRESPGDLRDNVQPRTDHHAIKPRTNYPSNDKKRKATISRGGWSGKRRRRKKSSSKIRRGEKCFRGLQTGHLTQSIGRPDKNKGMRSRANTFHRRKKKQELSVYLQKPRGEEGKGKKGVREVGASLFPEGAATLEKRGMREKNTVALRKLGKGPPVAMTFQRKGGVERGGKVHGEDLYKPKRGSPLT